MLYRAGDIVYLAGRPYRVAKDRTMKYDNLRIETPTNEDTEYIWKHINGDYRSTSLSTIDIFPQVIHLFRYGAKNNREAIKLLRRD